MVILGPVELLGLICSAVPSNNRPGYPTLMNCTRQSVLARRTTTRLFVSILAVLITMIGLALAPSSYGLTLADSLGQAKDYAVLGIGGDVSVSSDFSVYQSATVIDGNVGMGPYNTWGHGIDATINGRLDYDFTDSAPTIAKDGFVRDGMF